MTSLLPGGRLGRYQVIEEIGRGGMATVFRALDPSLKRDVAIKVLPSYMSEDPSFVDRFSQEAQAVAGLVHPNIIRVFDFGEDKGFSFIVMEYVSGGTLVDRLDRPLEVSEAVEFIGPLGEALQYAHGQGVVHRDIKPSNVLLNEAGRPILADFGLARMLEGSAYLTQAGEVLGTAEYMAPEQGLGRQADQRSDLYSLGIVTYQMLVGHTPFKADTPSATLMAHIHQPVPFPDDLDPAVVPGLAPVLMRALAKEPDDRYETPLELTQALESVLNDSPVAVAESPPLSDAAMHDLLTQAQQPAPSRSYRPALVAGLAVATAAVLAAAAFIAFNGGESDAPQTGETQPQATVESSATMAPEAAAASLEVTAVPAPVTEIQAPAIQEKTAAPQETLKSQVAGPLATIFQRASAIRGLEQLRPIVPEFVPRQRLNELAVQESLASRDQVLKDQALFEVLGLIPQGLDLYQLEVDILAESSESGAGRAALFDSETGTFYVASDLDDPTPFQEVEVVAEYSRALLHQHYGIAERLSSLEGEKPKTLETLVLGDATLTGLQYLSTHITPQRLADLPPQAPMPVLDAAPEFLKQRGFSIQTGVNFISSLSRSGQRSELRLVYSNPPESTEQLLHTEKYLAGEAPVEVSLSDLSSVLGSGWTEIYRGVMGEAFVTGFLAVLQEASAISAAEGWGGDRFSLLQGPEGTRALVARFAWDSAEDAGEFYSALESRPPGSSHVGLVGLEVLLVVGPDDGTVVRLRNQFPGF